jgi:hypothetical protein
MLRAALRFLSNSGSHGALIRTRSPPRESSTAVTLFGRRALQHRAQAASLYLLLLTWNTDFLQFLFPRRWSTQIFNDIFVRSHLRLADERSAFLDHEARCF